MVNVSMASQRGRWLKVVYGMNVNAWGKKKNQNNHNSFQVHLAKLW